MANKKYKVVIDVNSKKVSKDISAINKKMTQLNKTTQKTKNSAGVAGQAFVGFLGAIAVTKAFSIIGDQIKGMIREAAKIEQLEAQFTTFLKNATLAKEHLQDLREFSTRTPFQLDGIAKASKTLLAFGTDVDQIIPKLTQIGDAAAATGNSMSEIALIFGQVKAAGKLTGERFIQLAERGINVGPAVAEAMNVSEEAVAKLRTEGKITFEVFENAFKTLTTEGGKFAGGMERQSKTLIGLVSTLGDKWSNFLANAGASSTGFLKSMVEGLNEAIDLINKVYDLERVGSKTIGDLKAKEHDLRIEYIEDELAKEDLAWNTNEERVKQLKTDLATLHRMKEMVADTTIMDDLTNITPRDNFVTSNETKVKRTDYVSTGAPDVPEEVAEVSAEDVAAEKLENRRTYLTEIQNMQQAHNMKMLTLNATKEEDAINQDEEFQLQLIEKKRARAEEEANSKESAAEIKAAKDEADFQAELAADEVRHQTKVKIEQVRQKNKEKQEKKNQKNKDKAEKAIAKAAVINEQNKQKAIANVQQLALVALGENSKAAFLLSKAFAVADIMVQSSKANALNLVIAGQAASVGGPAAPAIFGATLAGLKATTMANTVTSLALVAAQTVSGLQKFETGGIVGGARGDNVMVRANVGEEFLTRDDGRTVRSLLRGGSFNGSNELLVDINQSIREINSSVYINNEKISDELKELEARELR